MILQIPSENDDCNCYIIDDEQGHAVLVDPSCADEILDELEKRSWKLDYIFLTHEHFDHIAGLERVRKATGAPVVACRHCSENVQTVRWNLSNIAALLEYYRKGKAPEGGREPFTCEPADITFEEEYDVTWRNHSFKFRRLPGHSAGSTVIFMDEEDVFTGDYLIEGEEDIARLRGSNMEDYENTAKPFLETIEEGTAIHPGHGPSYTR